MRNSLEKPAANAELWREKRFELIVDGTWISGEFDRVTLIKDANGNLLEAVILDYKTDVVKSDEELLGRVMTYSPQLKLYSRALARLTGLPSEKINANLAFVRIGKIIGIGSEGSCPA